MNNAIFERAKTLVELNQAMEHYILLEGIPKGVWRYFEFRGNDLYWNYEPNAANEPVE